MRSVISILLLLIAANVAASDLTLSRELLEDAVIRNDVEGMQLVRDRLLRLASSTDDRTVMRDAHYLIALSAMFESYSGEIDPAAGARLIAMGTQQADRAVEIDPKFADAWMLAAMLRGGGARFTPPPKDPAGTPNRFAHALELDAQAVPVAFFNAMIRSFNPMGAAPPQGVKLFDDLVSKLDADRAATGRRFGLWDAQAYAWQIMVRMASDDPRGETLRPMAARLLQLRPDFALAHTLAANVAEQRFIAPPSLEWKPFLSDAAGDGQNPKLPDVISVDRADDGDRIWLRVNFHDPLPRSFGINVAVNRSGDPSTGMPWWGKGSTFRFDRLVTAWISRDGDRYFGRVGVTDDAGARGAHLIKIPAEVSLALANNDRSLIVGVPRAAIGLTDASTIVVAGGSHLVWNDDATHP